MREAEHKSDFELRKGTIYRDLKAELRGVSCEYFFQKTDSIVTTSLCTGCVNKVGTQHLTPPVQKVTKHETAIQPALHWTAAKLWKLWSSNFSCVHHGSLPWVVWFTARDTWRRHGRHAFCIIYLPWWRSHCSSVDDPHSDTVLWSFVLVIRNKFVYKSWHYIGSLTSKILFMRPDDTHALVKWINTGSNITCTGPVSI